MSTATLTRPSQPTTLESFMHEVKVASGEGLKVFLGRFDHNDPMRGFVIEVGPSTVGENMVETKITQMTTAHNKKYFLYITNNCKRAIRARIKTV